MALARSRFRRRRGATILETALVLNVLLLILFGVLEYGHIIMIKQLLDNAAREGARMAVVSTNTYPPTTTAQIQNYVSGFLIGQVNNPTIDVYQADSTTGVKLSSTWTATPFGTDIAVEINATYHPILPTTFGIIPNPLSLTAKSVMRSEVN